MYKRLLVPTDGSSVSLLAAAAAIDLARAGGGEIIALSVAVPETILQSVEGAMVIDPRQQAEVLLDQAHGFVATVDERARKAGVACKPVARLAPDPARAIIDAAREYDCDLVVMGSHGRRGLSRLLAGSVTQAVLAEAAVPVMVLRPAPEADAVQALARSCPASGQG